MPQYSTRLNRICKQNGFTGSGEVADLIGVYSYELSKLLDDSPKEFLDLLIRAKKLKSNNQLRGI